MLNKLTTAFQAAKDFGFKWTFQRLFYELRLRTGYHKRILPKRAWKTNELEAWMSEGIDTKNLKAEWENTKRNYFFSIKEKEALAEAVAAVHKNDKSKYKRLISEYNPDKLIYFTHLEYEVTYPDVWFTNPFLSPPVQCERDKHWSDYPMHTHEYEDLKFIWEPGRFTVVYELVRRYVLTNDEKLPEYFWQYIESWIENNPPNTGPHWKCGQETSLRLMAWYFGWFAFKDSAATNNERVRKFFEAVAVQAYRVSKDLEYSYLQHSNHAISEGLGLYVTGVLFPQFKQAEEWRKIGKKSLIERGLFLIRADGTYIQKSHNYLRFILHAYLYVFGVADANGDTFPDELHERIKKALNYLISVCDKKSGRVPNFGSNDGALIFSVNSCDFRDFRPVINALHFYYYKTTWFEQGIWNEDLIWLFGANAAKAVVDKTKVSQNKPAIKRFDTGGIYVLNTKDTWAFIHAESYRDRPAHADALSVDLWWKGQNICIDPGTYLYYGKSPWLDAFKHTRYHNTMTVDGADQMKRAYRFTWGYWHDCEVVATKETAFFRYMTFSHNGYHRLSSPVTHQRTVLSLEDSYWVIIDDLLGEGTHEFLLHWLIHSFPSQAIEDGINLETPAGNYQLRILNASSEINVFSGLNHTPTLAKQSNYYGSLEDAIAVVCEEKQKLPIRRITLLGEDLSKAKYQAGANAMILLDEKTKISLHTVQMGKVIREVFINQSTNSDRLIKTTFN